LIPYALWGRRYEPSGKSIDLASGDELLTVPVSPAPGVIIPTTALKPLANP